MYGIRLPHSVTDITILCIKVLSYNIEACLQLLCSGLARHVHVKTKIDYSKIKKAIQENIHIRKYSLCFLNILSFLQSINQTKATLKNRDLDLPTSAILGSRYIPINIFSGYGLGTLTTIKTQQTSGTKNHASEQ